MNKLLISILGLFLISATAIAADLDSPQALKAKEMVDKVIDFYKTNGLQATIKAVNDTKGQFVDGDYYVFIHTFDGTNIARGDGNTKRLGSSVLDDQDSNGKFFVQEMIKKAQKDGSGWETYEFMNKHLGKVQTKHSYFERIDGAIVGCGYFE